MIYLKNILDTTSLIKLIISTLSTFIWELIQLGLALRLQKKKSTQVLSLF